MHVDLEFMVKTLQNVEIQHQGLLGDVHFNIDSRSLQQGEIFIALIGSKVDGHDFIEQALQRGASGFILAQSHKEMVLQKYHQHFVGKSVLFVPDTQAALISLAKAWRTQFTYPVIGVTGTVGKTTTKEILRNIFSAAQMPAVVSSGNQNTLIGISLNMLKMRPFHKVAVFEMGISDVGSMKQLADLVQPTYGVITQVGHGHVVGLGDISSIAREKREIFANFSERSIGVINGDQVELSKISYKHPVVRFGKKTINQIQARKIVVANNTISFVLKIYQHKYLVVLQSCNMARIMNALAATAVAHLAGVPDTAIIKGLELPVVTSGRFQVIERRSGATIINDAYNANPESVKASLIAFGQYETGKRKILVLGDMLGLGDESAFWHRQIGRFVRKVDKLSEIILIGSQVEWVKKTLPYGLTCTMFDSVDAATNTIEKLALEQQNIILFKASHDMRFAQLIQKIEAPLLSSQT